MTKRYLPAAAVAAVTVTADLVLLVTGVRSFPLLLLAAIGAPAVALLLGWAPTGTTGSIGKIAGAVALGMAVVPVLVVLTHGVFVVLAWAFVEPLADAGAGLVDQLEVDPTLVAVFTSPWALWGLVEMAVVAPLSEEFFKPLAAFWIRATSRREAFLVGAGVGAGFAAAENVMYASGWWWSFDSWLPIAVLRSAGAALHLLGAGLVNLAIYERRTRTGRSSILKTFGLAGGIHALWNGSIAVAIILFVERGEFGGGLTGTSLSWGIALAVFLGALGVVMFAGMILAGRWASTEEAGPSPLEGISLDRPAVVAGWATLACVMLLPLSVMILVFPDYLAL
jgi:RsiW-degrading membrane proteinase PrsW (M82 family)